MQTGHVNHHSHFHHFSSHTKCYKFRGCGASNPALGWNDPCMPNTQWEKGGDGKGRMCGKEPQ